MFPRLPKNSDGRVKTKHHRISTEKRIAVFGLIVQGREPRCEYRIRSSRAGRGRHAVGRHSDLRAGTAGVGAHCFGVAQSHASPATSQAVATLLRRPCITTDARALTYLVGVDRNAPLAAAFLAWRRVYSAPRHYRLLDFSDARSSAGWAMLLFDGQRAHVFRFGH